MRLQLPIEQSQGHREPDEPLLRSIVQVPFKSPPFGVGRLDDANARCAKVLELCVEFGAQPLALERQPEGCDDVIDPLGIVQQIATMAEETDDFLSPDKRRHGAPRFRSDIDLATVASDEAAVRQQIGDLEVGVGQLVREHVAQVTTRLRRVELHHELGHRRSSPPRPEPRPGDPGGHRPERDGLEAAKPAPGLRAERVAEQVSPCAEGDEPEEGRRGREDGPDEPAPDPGRRDDSAPGQGDHGRRPCDGQNEADPRDQVVDGRIDTDRQEVGRAERAQLAGRVVDGTITVTATSYASSMSPSTGQPNTRARLPARSSEAKATAAAAALVEARLAGPVAGSVRRTTIAATSVASPSVAMSDGPTNGSAAARTMDATTRIRSLRRASLPLGYVRNKTVRPTRWR